MSTVDLHERANSQVKADVLAEKGFIDTTRSPSTRFLTMLIRGYQAARSGRPTGCRYIPTCSEFAVEAIDTHGPAKGALMATRRIARCGPWGGHGVDPVPDRSNP